MRCCAHAKSAPGLSVPLESGLFLASFGHFQSSFHRWNHFELVLFWIGTITSFLFSGSNGQAHDLQESRVNSLRLNHATRHFDPEECTSLQSLALSYLPRRLVATTILIRFMFPHLSSFRASNFLWGIASRVRIHQV